MKTKSKCSDKQEKLDKSNYYLILMMMGLEEALSVLVPMEMLKILTLPDYLVKIMTLFLESFLLKNLNIENMLIVLCLNLSLKDKNSIKKHTIPIKTVEWIMSWHYIVLLVALNILKLGKKFYIMIVKKNVYKLIEQKKKP